MGDGGPRTIVYNVGTLQAVLFGLAAGGSFGAVSAVGYWLLDKAFG